MDKKARFMEAVAEKVGKRKPMMRRKGAPSVIIAIGAPKKPPMADEMGEKSEDKMDGEGEDKMKMSKAEKIAMLQEKIAGLKAELALLEDEEDMAEDEQDYEDEEESEDEEED
jgi:hypothetical protein